MSRKKIPEETQNNVLTQSRRRCCLCFYLDNDNSEKKGQLAHLDKDNSNNKEDNLAFLCLNHHDAYDSKSSQSKNYTLKEVKEYRNKLYTLNNPKTYDHKYLLNNTTQGDIEDYRRWVTGYKAKGGKVFHLKRENFNNLRIVSSKVFLKPFYGSSSVELLVEESGEVEFVSDNIGHSIIYYLNGFKLSGNGEPQDV